VKTSRPQYGARAGDIGGAVAPLSTAVQGLFEPTQLPGLDRRRREAIMVALKGGADGIWPVGCLPATCADPWMGSKSRSAGAETCRGNQADRTNESGSGIAEDVADMLVVSHESNCDGPQRELHRGIIYIHVLGVGYRDRPALRATTPCGAKLQLASTLAFVDRADATRAAFGASNKRSWRRRSNFRRE